MIYIMYMMYMYMYLFLYLLHLFVSYIITCILCTLFIIFFYLLSYQQSIATLLTMICTVLLLIAVAVSDARHSVAATRGGVREVGGVLCDEVLRRRGARGECRPQKCEWTRWYRKHYQQPEENVATRVVVR